MTDMVKKVCQEEEEEEEVREPDFSFKAPCS